MIEWLRREAVYLWYYLDIQVRQIAPYWALAAHANQMAMELRADMLAAGYEPYGDSSSNQQFFICTPEQARAFIDTCGCNSFLVLPDGREVVRFVCSWATQPEHVDELLEFARTLV